MDLCMQDSESTMCNFFSFMLFYAMIVMDLFIHLDVMLYSHPRWLNVMLLLAKICILPTLATAPR